MGTRSNIHFVLIFLTSTSVFAASPAQPESSRVNAPGAEVNELLILARERNPELASMRQAADAVADRINSSSALPDPVFRIQLQDFTNNASGTATTLAPSGVGSTFYRVMQPLPFWGKRDLKRDISLAETTEAQGRTSISWSELAAKIKIDFSKYYLVAKGQQLTQEMLALTLNLENIAKSRYSTGLAPQQDVIRAQVEQTSLRRDLVMLETERHHSMSRMNTLLLREPYAALAEPQYLRPIPPRAKLEFAVLAERLREHNPMLFTLQAQIDAADKGRELAYKNRYPDFAVGLGTTQMGNDIKSWELMVEFNIPLQQGSRRGAEREAENMLAAARSRKYSADSQLAGELAEYSTALDAALQVESITTNSLLPQSEATLQAAYVGYQNGKVDFTTLLDAQRQILKAKLDMLNAQAQAQASLAQIEKLLGEEL